MDREAENNQDRRLCKALQYYHKIQDFVIWFRLIYT